MLINDGSFGVGSKPLLQLYRAIGTGSQGDNRPPTQILAVQLTLFEYCKGGGADYPPWIFRPSYVPLL